MDQPRQLYRESERAYVWAFALAAGILSIVPVIVAFMARPSGTWYLGYQYNLDDHMVYAAWMRQAMEGRFFFDNRFATDPQPGLTVHFYFWVLGQVARFTGIPVATTLARFVLSVLFVHLLYRLMRRSEALVHTVKVGLGLAVFGGGIGFLVWQTFGVAIEGESALSKIMLGRLPTDVWQPEGFVFASMLTNSLFLISLCLILVVFDAVAVARHSPRAVLRGTLALGLLMNIHSYDVLIIALTGVAWLAATLVRGEMTSKWMGRIAIVALGAVPPALWFVHVLREDAVFQARAATETFSPNFRSVVFGYLILVGLGLYGAYHQAGATKRALAGVGIAGATILVMFFLATGHANGYFVGMPGWIAMYLAMIAAAVLLAGPSTMLNGFVAWGLVGLVAIYFPSLFQRKLSMGLAVPWGVLSGFAVTALLAHRDRSSRNLATALGLIVMAGSSVRWFLREVHLAQINVSNTTVHSVYLPDDVRRAIQKLETEPGRRIVLALPGVPSRAVDQATGQPIPDSFQTPIVPDLNPIAAGFAGVYAYAGHWSETPDYNNRRNDATKVFLANTDEMERNEILLRTKATHLLAPIPEAFPNLPLADGRRLGEVILEGAQFALVRLPAPRASTP
ncbi:hypothetical protein EON81_02180 [bacterium]|nr:MAG: hypothetical protein EON81_02180 [bacterium]